MKMHKGPAAMPKHHGKDAPKPSSKPVHRKAGAKRATREMDQHDRARKRAGSKAYKNLEGKSI